MERLAPEKLFSLPNDPESYEELHAALLRGQKTWAKLPDKKQEEHFIDYCRMYSTYFIIIADLKADDWPRITKAIIYYISNHTVQLRPCIREYADIEDKATTRDYLKQDLRKHYERLIGSLNEAKNTVTEIHKTVCPGDTRYRKPTQGGSVRPRVEGSSSSTQRVRPASVDSASTQALSENWSECWAAAHRCKVLIAKLYKVNEYDGVFAEKSLREINGEFIEDFCEKLMEYLSQSQISPHVKDLKSEVNNLRHLVQQANVQGVYDCFDRVWPLLVLVNLITNMSLDRVNP